MFRFFSTTGGKPEKRISQSKAPRDSGGCTGECDRCRCGQATVLSDDAEADGGTIVKSKKRSRKQEVT